MTGCDAYRAVWVLDFEFHVPAGELPQPLCLAAREVLTGRQIVLWRDELRLGAPPFDVGPDVLVVAYFASAEMGCFLALGWPTPTNLLDLYVEFRNMTNGLGTPSGNGLLGALDFFGLGGMARGTKDENQRLAVRGAPFSPDERRQLLEYCAADVDATARLLERMSPEIDLPRALVRGAYMTAVAHMERTGMPVDTEYLGRLRGGWPLLHDQLIATVDQAYGVFEGRTFKRDRFERLIDAAGIAWPRLETGAFALDDETFSEMSKLHPQLRPLHELRTALAQLRSFELPVGGDGRNRTLLSPFRSRTGRNQPSNSKFLFGLSAWLRGLIKPEAGWGLAYIDWKQQEFGIAAALSDDGAMMEAYASSDPYLAFAKRVGAAPADATKQSHGRVRDMFKQCVLAVQYGMGARGLARRLGVPECEAEELLKAHRRAFSRFWVWSEGVVNHGLLRGRLWTVFGWNLGVGPDPNVRSLANFPVQANGAEMMRLAGSYATASGVRVCAPVHDAFLVEAPLEELEATAENMRRHMARASRDVLGGFELGGDVSLVRHPDRFMDDRGREMWRRVERLLGGLAAT